MRPVRETKAPEPSDAFLNSLSWSREVASPRELGKWERWRVGWQRILSFTHSPFPTCHHLFTILFEREKKSSPGKTSLSLTHKWQNSVCYAKRIFNILYHLSLTVLIACINSIINFNNIFKGKGIHNSSDFFPKLIFVKGSIFRLATHLH